MKKEKQRTLLEVCEEIVRVSTDYSYLWDDFSFWDQDNSSMKLSLAFGWIAQDESFDIYVSKIKGEFLFNGRNFSESNEQGLNAKMAAERIQIYFEERYGIKADYVRKNFYFALRKPLGHYLAKESLKELTGGTI